jgi:broad specificity phosphatase PhoE
VTTGERTPGAPVTLHLVRHGLAAGAEGRCVGWADLTLASAGREQTERLAARWPAPHPARLVSSDLRRARETAALLAGVWGLADPVPSDPRLREMHFGRWEGHTWAELEQADGPALAVWMADWQESRAPEGEGFGDVVARARAWLEDTVAAARRDAVADLVAVAHAGSIRALLVHALGLPRALAFRVRLDHARVTALRIPAGPPDRACAGAELLFSNADRPPG